MGLGPLGPPAPPLSLWHRRIGLRAAFHLRRACRAALRGAADAAARGHGRAASPAADGGAARRAADGRAERHHTATPPAQGQAPSEEFFIEPEAFEFEPELDEYENGWGEFEGDFEQYETSLDELERGQSSQPAECPPYQRGEVERSRTVQGHLPSDVIRPPDGGLLITDFGVDLPTPKASLRRDAVLRGWLNEVIGKARTNASTKIYITGYSDCAGREKDNAALRGARAKQVQQLLQQLAGPNKRHLSGKVQADPASTGSYVADNSTIQGRAQNRGVRITVTSKIIYRPDTITARFPAPEPPSDVEEDSEYIQRVILRARELFGRTGKWDQSGMPINEANGGEPCVS